VRRTPSKLVPLLQAPANVGLPLLLIRAPITDGPHDTSREVADGEKEVEGAGVSAHAQASTWSE
jgi:hypothetical protein